MCHSTGCVCRMYDHVPCLLVSVAARQLTIFHCSSIASTSWSAPRAHAVVRKMRSFAWQAIAATKADSTGLRVINVGPLLAPPRSSLAAHHNNGCCYQECSCSNERSCVQPPLCAVIMLVSRRHERIARLAHALAACHKSCVGAARSVSSFVPTARQVV